MTTIYKAPIRLSSPIILLHICKNYFATTIPVLPDAVGRSNIERDLYNKAAVELMQKSGVAVNDMNSLLRADIQKYVCSDGLHLNDDSYDICTDSVVKNIERFI